MKISTAFLERNLSFLNYSTREINFKIVYYGPGLSGKTTNIKYIYEKIKNDNKGKLVSLATETERTLFFDFFPLELGTIHDYKVRFHLYTVPGQIYYSASRKLILKGVDGLVFVADSQTERFEANIESIQDMLENFQRLQDRLCRHPLYPAVEQARPAQCHAGQRIDRGAAQEKRAGAGGSGLKGTEWWIR